MLTPCDYPDGDGVVVQIVPAENGYVLTDGGNGDARLIVGGPGARAMGPLGAAVARRFGATFDGGRVLARVDSGGEVAEACWRVAQASVAIAEAATYHRPQRPREQELTDLVATSMEMRDLTVEREREIEGASGHRHKAALFVPERDAVIEPVGGEKAWNVASAVYVEFGDLAGVNGYQLIAVVDDRAEAPNEDVERLLRQVGVVARWSQADQWLDGLATARLV
ncbi:hypothetical protein [Paraconexibacter algicola]|uniref:hypothetical protein n=1 Tax=Paraconexibacter algicola TaxID=2133960 RepID=UPI0011B1E69B|nr:hypothetical protein [Paraconexibacter algicola]